MNARACIVVAIILAAGCGSGGSGADTGGSRDVPFFVDTAGGDVAADAASDSLTSDVPAGDYVSDSAVPPDHGVTDLFPDDLATGDDPGAPDATEADVGGTDPGGPTDPGSPTDPGPDAGAFEPECTRATGCGAAATCNLCSGKCEARSPGWSPFALLSAYPEQGAAGDMIVIDGAGFNSFTSVSVGGVSLSKNSDETRIVAFRADNAGGDLKVGSSTWDEPISTSPSFAGQQPCTGADPAASGATPAGPWEPGPYAAGFADYNGGTFGVKVRIYYPATCGGLRKPPADGKFSFVYFVHGDGYIPLNFEYLARHLATWGFMSAIPDNPGYSSFNTGRTSPGTWFGPLAGHETDSDAVIVCHSKGAEYTHDLGLANVRAVVFLGPVYTIEDPYGSLFPIQGMVIGWSTDGQVNTDKCYDVWQQLETPKWVVMIKGGTHGHFLDDKMWDPPSDGSGAFITRNRQHELTQAFVLPYMQRVFGKTEPFAAWLSDPGLSAEITLESKQ